MHVSDFESAVFSAVKSEWQIYVITPQPELVNLMTPLDRARCADSEYMYVSLCKWIFRGVIGSQFSKHTARYAVHAISYWRP